jgi:hypothetical protein
MFRRAPGVSSLWQRIPRVPGPLLDVGLALVVAVAVMIAIGVAPQTGRRPDALAYLLGLTIAALVLARRRWPVAALVASAAALQVYYLLDYSGIRPAGAAVGGARHRLGRWPSPVVTAGGHLVHGRTAAISNLGRVRTAAAGAQ